MMLLVVILTTRNRCKFVHTQCRLNFSSARSANAVLHLDNNRLRAGEFVLSYDIKR